jgi:tetratricopeptide (TPR) repeat protein
MYSFGSPPGLTIGNYVSHGLWLLGWPDRALVRVEETARTARRLDHRSGLAFALVFEAIAHEFRGDVAAQRERAAEAVALSESHGFLTWLGIGRAWHAAARVADGEPGAIADLLNGLALAASTQTQAGAPTVLALLCEARLTLGQHAEARGACEAGLAVAAQTAQHLWDAELHRLAGEIVLAEGGAPADAEAAFLRSLDVARAQEAKSFELRTATSLARLWRDQGRRDEARSLLAPIYGWFTEGFETRDLIEAKTLLGELASRV